MENAIYAELTENGEPTGITGQGDTREEAIARLRAALVADETEQGGDADYADRLLDAALAGLSGVFAVRFC
jgi:hypothetical protein